MEISETKRLEIIAVTKMATEFGIKLPELDINQEEPDFITKINGIVVGIEVTRVFANKADETSEFNNHYSNIFAEALRDMQNSSTPNKETVAIRYHIYMNFDEVWEDFEYKYGENDSKKNRKSFVESKRNELKEEFLCLIQNKHEERCTQYISYITTCKTDKDYDEITIENPVLISNLKTLIEDREKDKKNKLPTDLIESALSKKEEKLKKYKIKHPEVEEWILIIDLVHTSGLKVGKNFTIEKSNYDKIYVTQLLPPFAIKVYPN